MLQKAEAVAGGRREGRRRGSRRCRPGAGQKALIVVVACLAVAMFGWLFIRVPGATALPSDQDREELYLPNDPGRGGRLFISKGCIQCHAVRGEGGEVGPDLGRSTFGMNLTDIAAAMWNHAPAMGRQIEMMDIDPLRFEPGEMTALIAFLYYLNFSEVEEGDIQAGRQLFDTKACSRCHSIAGRGGSIGPSLDELEAFLSPVIVAQRMWNHGPEMVESFRELGLQPPSFSSRELTDLMAYVRASSTVALEARRLRFPGDARKGEELFRSRSCASCHSTDAQGRRAGPDLSESQLGVNVVEMATMLWNHMPRMLQQMEQIEISAPLFTETEMADLLSYLYSIHYRGREGNPQRGARLFDAKTCARCHTIGAGDDFGPDLAETGAARSLGEGVRLLWNHALVMVEMTAEHGRAWPRLSGTEISDILSYIREAGGSSP